LYLAALLLTFASISFGQTIITTFAGSRSIFNGDGISAKDAPVGSVSAVTSDDRGNVYFADITTDRVYKIDSAGTLTTVAGNAINGFSGDGGPATSAALFDPRGVAFDPSGNLYICDTGNFRIRKVTPSGIISTFAGNGTEGFSGDGGPAVKASLGRFTRIAIDRSGNVVISDADNHRVRRVTSDGIIRTVVGNGDGIFGGDGGPALRASLQAPVGMAFDSLGNLYVADRLDNRVRKVGADGTITTIAGIGGAGFSGDGGPAIRARLNGPRAVAVDKDFSVYIADSDISRIRKIDPNGNISTFAGTSAPGLQGDGGPASAGSLYIPNDLFFSPSGALIVADFNNLRVRSISTGGTITTIAGNGNFRYSGDGGIATNATLPAPSGLAFDASGNLHLCDNFANRVRTISPFGIINLTAGTNIPGFSGDGGPAASASLADCQGIAVDSAGNIYVADTGNRRIRKISATRNISTVAGNGLNAFGGDGQAATSASLSAPLGVAVDSQSNLYIADTGNNRIRKVTSAGIISTIAGTGTAGYSGDRGPATAATLNAPSRLALDSSGNLYLSDTGNNVVRRISTSGVITTVAGNGTSRFSGDGGPATSAALSNPQGLALDSSGVLYIADSDNHRVRRVGRDGNISTLAGNGISNLSGNGRSPDQAGLIAPVDVALDSSGNLYIADITAARVRRVQPAPSSIVLSQTGFFFRTAVDGESASPRTLRVLNGGGGTLSFTASSRTLSGGPNWLKISPSQGSTSVTSGPASITISVDPTGLAAGNYYGQIQIAAPGVINSPRFATVVLMVLSPSETPTPSVDPAGLVFTGSPGGSSPAAQTITVSKLRGAAVQFTSKLTFNEGKTFLTAQPSTGTVAPKSPVRITLQPGITGLPAQVYTASLDLTFSDGSLRSIPVALTLAAGAATSSFAKRQARDASCTAAKLVPVVTALGSGFSVPAGFPVTLEAKVVDDCGQPLMSGTVSASFSNGDPALSLTSLQDGTWAATWQPRNGSSVTVTVKAQGSPSSITGTTQISGQLSSNSDPPILGAGGILNNASYQLESPTAPGTLVAIFGSNLTTQAAAAGALPLPTQLNDTEILMGGTSMPLLYAYPNQVGAMVPFDVAANASQQVIVRRGSTYSVPESVFVSHADPGAFTTDATGKGSAIVAGVNADGSSFIVSPSAPAALGGVIVIYCTGLGAVQTTLEAGDPTPLSPLAQTTDTVTATIGGAQAQVLFSGLVPGFSGLYQVNAIVPGNAPTGDAVPLILTAGGAPGPSVNIAVK
jgi:uncharacterized protein (TIGR03437 family)